MKIKKTILKDNYFFIAIFGLSIVISRNLLFEVVVLIFLVLAISKVDIYNLISKLGVKMSNLDIKYKFLLAMKLLKTSPLAVYGSVKIHKLSINPIGEQLRVEIPKGGQVRDLEKVAEPLAAILQVRELKIYKDINNAAFADIVIVRRDPLENKILKKDDLFNTIPTLWDSITIGIDELGNTVQLSLSERNVLIGGEPGAGKSAALSLLLSAAALDKKVNLWLFDGKLVELAIWKDSAKASVGIGVDEAIDVLKQLQIEMTHRYEYLLDNRRRKITPMDGFSLEVIACDEMAYYLTCPNRKHAQVFTELFRDIVSRGRAAGIIALAATQKPSVDIVPSSLRDLFSFRWAFRCTTPQASDTILGSGWASRGYSAANIDSSARGVGFLLHEGGYPVRMKSYYLDDDFLLEIAQRSYKIRNGDSQIN